MVGLDVLLDVVLVGGLVVIRPSEGGVDVGPVDVVMGSSLVTGSVGGPMEGPKTSSSELVGGGWFSGLVEDPAPVPPA